MNRVEIFQAENSAIELEEKATVAIFATVQKEVIYFRKWVPSILKNYLINNKVIYFATS